MPRLRGPTRRNHDRTREKGARIVVAKVSDRLAKTLSDTGFLGSRKMCIGLPEKRAPPGRPVGLGLAFRQHVRMTKKKFRKNREFFSESVTPARRARGRPRGPRATYARALNKNNSRLSFA